MLKSCAQILLFTCGCDFTVHVPLGFNRILLYIKSSTEMSELSRVNAMECLSTYRPINVMYVDDFMLITRCLCNVYCRIVYIRHSVQSWWCISKPLSLRLDLIWKMFRQLIWKIMISQWKYFRTLRLYALGYRKYENWSFYQIINLSIYLWPSVLERASTEWIVNQIIFWGRAAKRSA